MLTYIRYALATVCFAASVGCLALWGWTLAYRVEISGPNYFTASGGVMLVVNEGFTFTGYWTDTPSSEEWKLSTGPMRSDPHYRDVIRNQFGLDTQRFGRYVHFPLWYPALIFALAGVGVLRLGRFTLRSAIIATTVLAGLLGMAVVL
jgi:hypothetical protein